MLDVDVIVVGAGIFGSIIAKALRAEGHSVLTLDAALEGAGSKPAACLMKPSWFSSLGKGVYDPALQLLDKLYGVEQVTFKLSKASAKVYWCQPDRILQPPNRTVEVTGVAKDGQSWKVDVRECPLFARTVVVATGVWAEDLAPVEGGMTGLAGVAYLWSHLSIAEPFVRVWAPYRQLVAFNRGDGLWVGDGTAIKENNWTGDREMTCLRRCTRAVDPDSKFSSPLRLWGVRPYVKQKPCYLKEAEPGLWVATGGAKNGTLAAAWCASELARALA